MSGSNFNALDYMNQNNVWQDAAGTVWQRRSDGSAVPVQVPDAVKNQIIQRSLSGYPWGLDQSQQSNPDWFTPNASGAATISPTSNRPYIDMSLPTKTYPQWQSNQNTGTSAPSAVSTPTPTASSAAPSPSVSTNLPMMPIGADGKPLVTSNVPNTGSGTPANWQQMLVQQQAGRTTTGSQAYPAYLGYRADGTNALQSNAGTLHWMQLLQQQNPSFFNTLLAWIGLRNSQQQKSQQASTTTPNDNGYLIV